MEAGRLYRRSSSMREAVEEISKEAVSEIGKGLQIIPLAIGWLVVTFPLKIWEGIHVWGFRMIFPRLAPPGPLHVFFNKFKKCFKIFPEDIPSV